MQDLEGTRLPPQNLEAERAVLGSMLRDNAVIGDVLQILREEDFYPDAHRKVFAASTALHDAGKPVDLVTLAETLKARGQIEDLGGYGYLAELWDAAPTAANAEYYAHIVRDKAIVRHLIHASTEILCDSYDQVMPADELLEAAERKVLDIAQMGITGQTYDAAAVVREVYDRMDARSARGGRALGVPTGFEDLDRLMAGLQDSELIVVAARPSLGKTSFGLSVAGHAALELGLPVLFVSLEQTRHELVERLMICEAKVDSQRVRLDTVAADERQRLIDAGRRIGASPLWIDDSPGQSMLRIAANARRLKLRKDIKLVVLDYLQLVQPEPGRKTRQEEVSGISRRLKGLARELQIPVLALAQLNRAPEDRADGRPRLSDLRESGAIEMDADVVMLLHQPKLQKAGAGTDGPADTTVVELILAKQRNGPTGEVPLVYRKPYMRFENYFPM
jgi:replicative DNA helicase